MSCELFRWNRPNSSLIRERRRRLTETACTRLLQSAWPGVYVRSAAGRLPIQVLFCEANLDFRLFLFFPRSLFPLRNQ